MPQQSDPGVFGDIENSLPTVPSIGGPVQAPISPGRPEWSLCGDEHGFRVAGIDPDLADVPRVLEPHIFPGLAAVDGFVNAIAVGHAALRIVLTCPDPHDVGIIRIELDDTDRIRSLAIENRCPGDAIVVGLPEITRGGGDEVPVPRPSALALRWPRLVVFR